MSEMMAVQISGPGGPFEVVKRAVPEPSPNTVRIKIQACGVCHSDAVTKEGLFPGISYPRVPGHEVVGIIDPVDAVPLMCAGITTFNALRHSGAMPSSSSYLSLENWYVYCYR